MAVNLASKYSSKVDEKFALESKTTNAVNTDFDFVGVQTVEVYGITTQALGDYTRTGANRYGTPAEVQDVKQTLTLTQDKSFSMTIDRGNNDEQMMIKKSGEALARQIREQVVPTIDKRRLSVMGANAGTTATTTVTSSNAYDMFLDGTVVLTDNSVSEVGRIAYVAPGYYKLLKQDSSFILASDMAQDMLVKGSVGSVDGINIIPVPTSYLPTDVQFIITHPQAVVSPIKLEDYKIHDNPPGISGWLIEGRVIYDAFVLNNKEKAVYVHKNASSGN